MALGLAGVGKVALGGLAAKLFAPRGKNIDMSKLIRQFLSTSPTATLSPEDIAMGERYRSAGSEMIGQGQRVASGQAMRRFAARGIAGPAQEQALSDIAQGGAVARSGLSREIANLLEGSRQKTLDYARNKQFTAFGAQVGEAGQQRAIQGAQSAAYWNAAIPALTQLGGLKFPAKAKDWEFLDTGD